MVKHFKFTKSPKAQNVLRVVPNGGSCGCVVNADCVDSRCMINCTDDFQMYPITHNGVRVFAHMPSGLSYITDVYPHRNGKYVLFESTYSNDSERLEAIRYMNKALDLMKI